MTVQNPVHVIGWFLFFFFKQNQCIEYQLFNPPWFYSVQKAEREKERKNRAAMYEAEQQ